MVYGIASDHGGYELKAFIQQHFHAADLIDMGTDSPDRVDYPVYADRLCVAILKKEVDGGLLICGTGIGISMRANRYDGIRAALIYDDVTANMAKAHNNANVICLGGRTTDFSSVIPMITTWHTTPFDGGRHTHRINQLDAPRVL